MRKYRVHAHNRYMKTRYQHLQDAGDSKQYRMVGLDGFVCGSIWADKVELDRSGSYWFYLKGEAILTAWHGYDEQDTDVRHLVSEEKHLIPEAEMAATIPAEHLGYEEQTDEQEQEARAAYEANPKPVVRICSECNEPIIDGQASCHKVGCKSNQEIEF